MGGPRKVSFWEGRGKSVFFLSGLFRCLGSSDVCFCCLGGGVFSFLLFGRGGGGGVFDFLLFGQGRVSFFAVRAGGVSFLCCWGGDGSLLTYRPAWLGFKGPNSKKDQTANLTAKKTKQQKKTRIPGKDEMGHMPCKFSGLCPDVLLGTPKIFQLLCLHTRIECKMALCLVSTMHACQFSEEKSRMPILIDSEKLSHKSMLTLIAITENWLQSPKCLAPMYNHLGCNASKIHMFRIFAASTRQVIF